MRQLESIIQTQCVEWFKKWQYPNYANLLFSVPNGGSRNRLEAIRLQKEGVTPGVADLILLIPNKDYNALCVEMKTPRTGRQQESQKKWQEDIEAQGYKYSICRSFDEFRVIIEDYLSNK